MTPATKKLVLQGLSYLRSDDYERAKSAFAHCTPAQMQEVWSGNGETRQQVLDGYKAHVDAVDAAIKEVQAL